MLVQCKEVENHYVNVEFASKWQHFINSIRKLDQLPYHLSKDMVFLVLRFHFWIELSATNMTALAEQIGIPPAATTSGLISFPCWANEITCTFHISKLLLTWSDSIYEDPTVHNQMVFLEWMTLSQETGIRRTCIAVTNSGKPRNPCRLVSAIAQTLIKLST